MSSPAERYAAAARKRKFEQSELGRFTSHYPFELDSFQLEGCKAIDEGIGVLVAAPTGAGKTVVGEYAIFKALAVGKKAFYTTPIKALSNQKYTDFVRRHGEEAIGLLTGDTSINPDAPIIVMTTEVLRNMIYAGSSALDGLGYVVMDEVHYLADRFRGPVWEEIILHLDPKIQIVSLSATVSNAEEFGQWLGEVRGDTAVVVSEYRPVPLWQHVMVGHRLFDLYSKNVDPTNPGPNPPISPDLVEAINNLRDRRSQRRRSGRDRGRNGSGHFVRPPARTTVVEALDRAALLPAIVFVFSRAGCDDAVRQVIAGGTRLTTSAEQKKIQRIIDRHTKDLPREDLEVLDFWRWQHALLSGVGAHHAGLLPVFKETVEELFAAGLLKVVYATETLALGINMPARSVVLERLVKWDGQRHADLTAGEYTQLTGRAGRRGIDVEGHAIVLYSGGLDPVALAGLASRRTYPLKSAFRPSYNMAVNLLATSDVSQARDVLEMSFAQFQADRAVVGLARQSRKLLEAKEGYANAMTCHLGDFEEYMALRAQISAREKELSRARSRAQRSALYDTVSQFRRGDIIRLPRGRRHGHAVVLTQPEFDADGPVISVVSDDARFRRLRDSDIPVDVHVVGKVRVGKKFNSRRTKDRVDLASAMRSTLGAYAKERPKREKPRGGDATVEELRRQLRAHPCHGCADRDAHARWANRWQKVDKEYQSIIRRIEGRTSSIAHEFDKVTKVLLALGYLDDAESGLTVTDQGLWLRKIYSEQDLVVAQAIRDGLWHDLDAASLAGVVAGVMFEPRSDEPSPVPKFTGATQVLGDAIRPTARLARELIALEADFGISVTRPLDYGLVLPIYHWASGYGLDVVLADSDLAPGDFVRWARQVIDLLDQIALIAPTPPLRAAARQAIDYIRRGVVAQGALE